MTSDNFEKLRELLSGNKNWPLFYMFKFIVPNNSNKVKQVADLMPKDGEISYKHTKNLNYVSLTCKVLMPSVDSIIEVTEKATSIPEVIML